ncbi:synaptotagmin-15-like [Mercenaria mercenaria]|uniref:synaptotagmin-15-like n=1 Tax=Mercenaria mercenaria TaxID=6596 RepID=UPI00234EA0EB|nr:synaptotagmin-15-like [Mercenaria mercenaria]
MSDEEAGVSHGKTSDPSILKEYLDTNGKMSLFYLVACVTGIFLLLLFCVIVMLIKNRRKHRSPSDFFLTEPHEGRSSCKSAPMSRKTSPVREKRKSCPDTYGAVDEAIARSSTFDSLPNMEMEWVQPSPEGEKSKSMTALQYQASFLGAHPQVSLTRSESENLVAETSSPSDHGRILFTVLFDVTTNTLLVTLIKVKELQGRNSNENYRDPFVKMFLLPDENICHTSKTVKKTLNPVFNETFNFEVNYGDIKNRSLRFSVYDVDRRRLRHTLGHAIVPLQDVNISSSGVISKDLELEINYGSSVGDLNIALSYLPHTERLKIVILRARNIRPKPDPDTGFHVRLLLYYGNKLVKNKRTLTQMALPEVNFNESFAFSTTNKSIENFNFVVTLVKTNRQAISNDVDLGHVTLGSFMYARGAGLIHWQEMLAKTRNVVTKWHQLSVPV